MYFDESYLKAFGELKERLVSAPIIISPNWSKSFEVICYFSGVALGVVLGQRRDKILHPIYYASKALNKALKNYIVTEQDVLAVVFAFEKYRSYLVGTRAILHTDHSSLRYFMSNKDPKPRLIRRVILLQVFDFEVKDRKGTKNHVVGHLSRLENEAMQELGEKAEIDDTLLDEHVLAASLDLIPWLADFANYLASNIVP